MKARSMILLHVHEHISRYNGEHALVLWLVFQTVSFYFTKSSLFSSWQASMSIVCYIASKLFNCTQSDIEFLVFVMNRLVAETNQLESEKAQKEVQVQKVMEENVRLHAMLDKKEAQLQAMSEQCKLMALNHHN